jgi:uncharacterized protein
MAHEPVRLQARNYDASRRNGGRYGQAIMEVSAAMSRKTSVSAETSARIAAFLDAHHVMSLATCGSQGPHAANLFYVRDGFVLLWVSDPNSRHSMELKADHRVAATIAPDYRDFGDVCGLQICGTADCVTGASERRRAQALLKARYPFLKRLSAGPAAMKSAYESAEVYRLDPQRMVIIDNRRGFGHKDTLDFPAPD